MSKERNEIHVKIAEVKTGSSPDILKATLGSCVGIAFIWKEKNKFGLAHCLLPEAPGPSSVITARYVTQAIPSLMILMKLTIEDMKSVEVHVAGGGNMMSQLAQRNDDHVGVKNSECAIRVLKTMGIKVKSTDLGGDSGRQIFVDCIDGSVEIIKLPRSMQEVS